MHIKSHERLFIKVLMLSGVILRILGPAPEGGYLKIFLGGQM